MTGGWRPPTPEKFPSNLPIWDLTAEGLVIADFPINEVKGLIFSIQNSTIRAAQHGSSNFIVWDYENEEFIYTHLSGTNWAGQFASITGSEFGTGTAQQHEEVTQDDINYRAVPAV